VGLAQPDESASRPHGKARGENPGLAVSMESRSKMFTENDHPDDFRVAANPCVGFLQTRLHAHLTQKPAQYWLVCSYRRPRQCSPQERNSRRSGRWAHNRNLGRAGSSLVPIRPGNRSLCRRNNPLAILPGNRWGIQQDS
jgi:hypothetical protein